MLGSPGPQGTVQLAALILNDLQRLEVWKISQCLCRDATQLIVLQHPIIRKKKTLLKNKIAWHKMEEVACCFWSCEAALNPWSPRALRQACRLAGRQATVQAALGSQGSWDESCAAGGSTGWMWGKGTPPEHMFLVKGCVGALPGGLLELCTLWLLEQHRRRICAFCESRVITVPSADLSHIYTCVSHPSPSVSGDYLCRVYGN